MIQRTLCGVTLLLLFMGNHAFGQMSSGAPGGSAQPSFQKFRVKFEKTPPAGANIYDQGSFAWNGYPNVVQAPDGRLFMAWAAAIGFARGDRVVGAFSEDGGRTWGDPIELVNHPDLDDSPACIFLDGRRLVVLAEATRLPDHFDKTNPWPTQYDRTWWTMISTSDSGKTWSTRVPFSLPHSYTTARSPAVRLRDGTLLLPYGYDVASERGTPAKLERDMRSASGIARSTDGGRTWVSGETIENCGADDCDEPAAVMLSNGELLCVMRTETTHLYASHSRDEGRTWDEPRPIAIVAGKSVPFALFRLQGGQGDELVAAWNYLDRFSLVAAYSPDGGKTWTTPKLVARPNPELRYTADNPELTQTKDGTIVMAWQQENLPRHLGKEIWIARFNRAWLTQN